LADLFGVGTQPQDVTVGVFNVEFQSPREVGWGHADGDALGDELLVEFLGVFDADPDPGCSAALILAAEVECSAIAGDAGEVVSSPMNILEAKLVDVEVEGGLHIFDAKDGLRAFEMDGGVGHDFSGGDDNRGRGQGLQKS
jgi:hypothetical protein